MFGLVGVIGGVGIAELIVGAETGEGLIGVAGVFCAGLAISCAGLVAPCVGATGFCAEAVTVCAGLTGLCMNGLACTTGLACVAGAVGALVADGAGAGA